jgi:hypothetical protein
MLAALGTHRQQVEQREAALYEAANQLERVTAPNSWLDDEQLQSISLSEYAVERLPQPKLKVAVTPAADGGRRVQVTVAWKTRHGAATSVQLAAWQYPRPAPRGPEQP